MLYLKHTSKAIRQNGSDAVAITRRILQKKKKKATGFTANSVRYEVTANDFSIEFKLLANDSFFKIDKGRKPNAGLPPSIFSRKGRHLNLWFGVKRIPRNMSTDWAVRSAIDKKGIDPVPVAAETQNAVKDLFKRNIAKALKEDIYKCGYAAISNAMK